MRVVRYSVYGGFTYGTVVDHQFVPDLPSRLFLEGKFDHSLNIMQSHASHEGLAFASPFDQTPSEFDGRAYQLLGKNTVAMKYITDVVYPDLSGRRTGYRTQQQRLAQFLSEIEFSCNTRYMDRAFIYNTYASYFNVQPGLHAGDVPYIFNDDTTALDYSAPVNATVAEAMQSYIVNFAMAGNPNGLGLPLFPKYGVNSTILTISGLDGFESEADDLATNRRCDWWQYRGL
jgi:cholinesterase